MNWTGPKVCVGVFSFNHAKYIRQALDSVLAQQTDFNFEIVVHDDCSTDGTREIVAQYAAAHPDRLRAVLQDKNQFSQGRRVVLLLMAAMAGEYYALLDGDDFWSDPRKLQVQADFLDANPACALCQTLTSYYDEAEDRIKAIFPPRHLRRQRLDCADLAFGNFVQTSAVMFRASALPEIPPAYNALKFGDYALFALLAQAGWIGNIGRPMATYRIHTSNLWVKRPQEARIEATREVLKFLADHLHPELRAPWAEAARMPRARLNPPFATRCLRAWGGLTNRLRRVLRMEPR